MAKKAEQPKVDTNFENDFWNAASELRSAVTEQRYKDSVVSLLFLKHLPERYEIHKEKISISFNDPKKDYYLFNESDKNFALDDELEHQLIRI